MLLVKNLAYSVTKADLLVRLLCVEALVVWAHRSLVSVVRHEKRQSIVAELCIADVLSFSTTLLMMHDWWGMRRGRL